MDWNLLESSKEELAFIRSSFDYLEHDLTGKKRIYFENAGGSLRLKEVVKEEARYASYPDCPERSHRTANMLRDTIEKGMEDIRSFMNYKNGSVYSNVTASKAMFEIIGIITGNTPGDNIVTTEIEHPSSYDACKMYATKTKKELRVAKANSVTGTVNVEDIVSLVDRNTSLLSVIYTSNLTGAVLDVEKIVKEARQVNPDIYVVVDAVQAAPHTVLDVDKLQIDALTIAPYKMFGNRGVSFCYISERVQVLPHNRLLATEKDNWTLGSAVPAHFAGFTKIMDYLCKIGSFYTDIKDRRSLIKEGMYRIAMKEQALLRRLIMGLKEIDRVNIHFTEQPIEQKNLILAIAFDNVDCRRAVSEYEGQGILVFERVESSLYSKRILNAVGLKEIVRISPLHCHSFEEVDDFLRATKKIANL
jgi:cysteine desulfurase / selenocysteine lyase